MVAVTHPELAETVRKLLEDDDEAHLAGIAAGVKSAPTSAQAAKVITDAKASRRSTNPLPDFKRVKVLKVSARRPDGVLGAGPGNRP